MADKVKDVFNLGVNAAKVAGEELVESTAEVDQEMVNKLNKKINEQEEKINELNEKNNELSQQVIQAQNETIEALKTPSSNNPSDLRINDDNSIVAGPVGDEMDPIYDEMDDGQMGPGDDEMPPGDDEMGRVDDEMGRVDDEMAPNTGEQPFGEQPFGEQPFDEQPFGEQPFGEQQFDDGMAANNVYSKTPYNMYNEVKNSENYSNFPPPNVPENIEHTINNPYDDINEPLPTPSAPPFNSGTPSGMSPVTPGSLGRTSDYGDSPKEPNVGGTRRRKGRKGRTKRKRNKKK